MLNIINHNSYYILRLKESTLKKERKNLTGKDENIYINMNNSRLRNVDNKEIKEKFSKEGLLTLRIIKIPLAVNKDGNQEIEYLVTNLPKK